MATTEISLRDKIQSYLQQMDDSLLQRIADYAAGLIDASEKAWWDELSDSDKDIIDRGINEPDENLISKKDVFEKIRNRNNG